MTETARLTMASPLINIFGLTVAISDQAAVVGSLFSGASGRGFVFVRPPGGWASMTETARLAPAVFTASDLFAGNVALAGHQAIVTADERNGGAGGEQGAAFLFDLNLDDCNTNGVADLADIAAGTSRDTNGNFVPDECEVPPCPADTNGDHKVNVTDLLAVITTWGACDKPCPPRCITDTNGDCSVNVTDLLAIIVAWGACP